MKPVADDATQQQAQHTADNYSEHNGSHSQDYQPHEDHTMPKGGRHGNLSPKASRIYEALRREGYSKTKSAKIANASVAGTINYRGRKNKKRK